MSKVKQGTRVAALIVAAAALSALGAGCNGGGDKGATGTANSNGAKKVSITGADRKEAHEMFNTRCAACHGQFGRGDGPGAAGLNPKPRNYADAAWQSTVTDEEIEKAIVYGGAAVGKSPQMVANPDLQAKPGVVAALREKVRSFGQ
ncbi:MAG: c-type cytochrome [bacterium]|nr:c-type cytochrome [bacterium]